MKYLLPIFLTFCFACNQEVLPSHNLSNNSNLLNYSRTSLLENLRKHKKIAYIYSANHTGFKTFFEKVEHPRLNFEKKVIPSNQVDFSALNDYAIFLVGSHSTNEVIRDMNQQLPIQFGDLQFKFDQYTYNDINDIIKIHVYPNPFNEHLPLYLISGNNNDAIIQLINSKYQDNWESQFWASRGYEVIRNQHTSITGFFNDSTWIMDKVTHFDLNKQVDTLLKTAHYNFIAKSTTITNEELSALGQTCETQFQRIQEFLGQPVDIPTINYHIYPTMEVKGLQISNTDAAQCDIGKNCVFVIHNETLKGQLEHPEHELILKKTLGSPQVKALDCGLRIYFTNSWHRKGFRYWAKLVHESNTLPKLDQLLDNKKFDQTSSFLRGAIAAALVDFLITEQGKDQFIQRYAQWSPSPNEIKALQQRFDRFLSNYPAIKRRKTTSAFENTYQKGFNFAHEGYRIYNGYGSQLAKQSLHKLAQLSANSIAIVPYSYMGNANRPSMLNISHRAGSENDESVITAHYNAKSLGMTTLLKPQIWLGSSWPGDVEMTNENDWKQFFKYYSDWIIHYAILAEIYEFDALCVGVEFVKATTQRPNEWRNLIQNVRKIYSGQVTYAANWGEEFEQLSFWDELDFIGLNCYYPLSEKESPQKADLKKRFASILDKAEKVSLKYEKPLVFTEIGFRSVATPWLNPHADSGGRPYNEKAQKTCYEVVFEGIDDKNWITGIYWWKWPSYLSYAGQNNKSFTPNKKIAEQVILEWFSK